MQFRVPQFIDIEDKLFGPFTFKQFAYIVGGGGMIFVIYKLFPFFIAVFLIIPIAILTVALTFYKINGKPFIFYLQASLEYAMKSKLYVWKQRLVKPDVNTKVNDVPKSVSVVPQISKSSLNDISWNLDIAEKTEK